jgi:hypothetical protein
MVLMKPINYPNFNDYLIDENGNIYSTLNSKRFPLKQPKVLKQWSNKNVTYKQVTLQNKRAGIKPSTFYVHRLVALTFIENPNNLPEVNHKDCDKFNNNVYNLEWCTHQYNMEHMNLNVKNKKNKSNKLSKFFVFGKNPSNYTCRT